MSTSVPSYKRELLYATIGMDEYIRRFRDAERVAGYCRTCPNYGHHWGCPPFDYSVEDELRRYREVQLVAARIYPEEKHLPLTTGMRCLWPVRAELEHIVRSMETTQPGRAMGLAGQCTYCGASPDFLPSAPAGQSPTVGLSSPDGLPCSKALPCTKPQGLPCRHPELVRPSLEAWGFDVGKTAEELLQTPILWSSDGLTPDYFTLVCAFFRKGV